MMISSNAVQPENAAAPMLSTPAGMIILPNLSHAKNACEPIDFAAVGSVICSSWWREWNALLGIAVLCASLRSTERIWKQRSRNWR